MTQQPESSTNFVRGEVTSGTKWVMPESETEPRLMVRQADIRRWKEWAARLGEKRRNAEAWTTAFVGVFIGTGVSAVSAMLAPGPTSWGLVLFLAVVTIFSIVTAAFMNWFQKDQEETLADESKRFCKDIDDVATDPTSKVEPGK